jgi:hypothetical protein
MSASKFNINNLVSIKVEGYIKVSCDKDPSKEFVKDFESMKDFSWSPAIIISKKQINGKWFYHVACPWYKYVGVYYLINVSEKFLTKYDTTLSERDKSNICYFLTGTF